MARGRCAPLTGQGHRVPVDGRCPDSVNDSAMPMAHASTDAQSRRSPAFPPIIRKDQAGPERHVRQLHDATEQPVVADLQTDRELLTDPPHFASGKSAGETPMRTHPADAETPDVSRPRYGGPAQHLDRRRQPRHVVYGAARDQGVDILHVRNGTRGQALRRAARGAQRLGDALAMPAVDPAAVGSSRTSTRAGFVLITVVLWSGVAVR